MAYVSHTATPFSGTGTNCNLAVPPDVVAGHILLYIVNIAATGSGAVVTWPAGFTEHPSSPLTVTTSGHRMRWATKKADGTESGTFTCSISGNELRNAAVIAYSGRHATDYLHSIQTFTVGTNAASPKTVTVATHNTTVDGCDLIYVAALDGATNPINASWTPPSGYSERVDITSGNVDLTVADIVQATKGATGGVAGSVTYSGNAAAMAFVLALAPAAGGGGIAKHANYYYRQRRAA